MFNNHLAPGSWLNDGGNDKDNCRPLVKNDSHFTSNKESGETPEGLAVQHDEVHEEDLHSIYVNFKEMLLGIKHC